MHLIEHEKHSIQQLGLPFTEVHNFLDQFARKYNMSMVHRLVLHHWLGVEVVGLEFGPDAKEAARLHIRDDLRGMLPTGPEWFLTQTAYIPTSGQEDSLEADMRALLGYAPDFNADWQGDRGGGSFKCACGFQGPTPGGTGQCPWCRASNTERISVLLHKLRS